MTDKQFKQAMALGPLALLRLRAEVLLQRIDDAQRPVKISDEQREQLDRIASAPQLNDSEFLGSFDYIYEEDERNDQA